MSRSRIPPLLQTTTVVLFALGVSFVLYLAATPAPFLLGSIAGAAVLGMFNLRAGVPGPLQHLSQALLGVLIAEKVATGFNLEVVALIPAFIGVSMATLALCGVLGVAIARTGAIPGTSAIWGVSPGAASAMVIMSGSYGADPRIVSLMQYTRVLFVSMTSAVVIGSTAHPSPAAFVAQLHAVDVGSSAGALAIALCGMALTRVIPMPAGNLMLPMIFGAALMAVFRISLTPSPVFLLAAYLVLGVRIGGGFSRQTLTQFRAVLIPLVGSVLLLIGISLAVAFVFSRCFGIGFQTAYLALSPGGLDTAAIIGASGGVDMHVVMVSQTLRMVMVTAFGPLMVRALSRWVEAKEAPFQP